MSVIIDGTSGVSTPNTFAFKNRIINGGFTFNQRGQVSGTALASGAYGHDRWKGGASGGTYTFTQLATGVNTTITITAGSLQQVIEGANLPEGGTYVLSWTGTAQARFNSGSYGASPLAVTGITAGTNTTIEFNTGTCGSVQLEVGTQATSFDYRSYGTELALCQRYYEVSYTDVAGEAMLSWQFTGSSNNRQRWWFKQNKRASPTVTAPLGWTINTPTINAGLDGVGFFSTGFYYIVGAGGAIALTASAEF